jgi:hypothetical protein
VSVASTIRAAAVTAVQGLGLSPTPTVKARKRPGLPDGATVPAVSVSVALPPPGDVEVLYAGKVLVNYTVTVAAYVPTTGANQDGDTLGTWRQSIGRALDDRDVYAAAGDVNEVYRTDGEVFDAPAHDAGYDVSFQNFRVEMIEDRN